MTAIPDALDPAAFDRGDPAGCWQARGGFFVTKSYARRMQRVEPSAIRELLRLGADPEVISFGGGYTDPALFPVAELADVFAELLVPERAESLQYTASVGLSLLRAQVAERWVEMVSPVPQRTY